MPEFRIALVFCREYFYLGAFCLLYTTQDNTPPPIFTARSLLHSSSSETPRVSVPKRASLKRSRRELFENVRLVLQSCLLRSKRALKISPGGVCYLVSN